MNKTKGRRGMTLVEVLFAVALTAVVISAGVTALYSGMTLYGRAAVRGAQQSAAYATMDAMMEGMRRDPDGVRVEGGTLHAGGMAFGNAGGHVVVDKTVWVEFAALHVERDGRTVSVSITTDGGVKVARVWTLR